MEPEVNLETGNIREFDELRILKDDGFRAVIVVTMSVPGRVADEVSPLDGVYFIADRDYEFLGGTFRYNQVGGSGSTMDIVKAASGTAASGGTSLLNATISLVGSVNTNNTLVAKPDRLDRLVPKGTSIGFNLAGTISNFRTPTATLRLRAL